MSLNFSKHFKAKAAEPSAHEPRRWSFAGILPAWVFVSFILAQVVVVAIAQLLKVLHVNLAALDETILNTLISIIIYGLTLAIVIIVPRKVRKTETTKEDMGVTRWPLWSDIGLAVPGFIVYIVLSAVLTSLAVHLPWYDASQTQNTGFGNFAAKYEYVLAFFSLVVLAPVAEELLFRGYLLGKLKKHIPVWAAVLITSLLFAVLHGSWNVGVDVFALSLILCSLRLLTGSIWAGVLVHMIKNCIAFYILFISPLLFSTIGG